MDEYDNIVGAIDILQEIIRNSNKWKKFDDARHINNLYKAQVKIQDVIYHIESKNLEDG